MRFQSTVCYILCVLRYICASAVFCFRMYLNLGVRVIWTDPGFHSKVSAWILASEARFDGDGPRALAQAILLNK